MKPSLPFWRLNLLVSAGLSGWALVDILRTMHMLGISTSQTRWLLLLGLFSLLTAFELVFLGLTWNRKVAQSLEGVASARLPRAWMRRLALLAFVLLLGAFSWLVMFSPLRGFLMTNSSGTLISLGEQNGHLRIVDLVYGNLVNPLPGFEALFNSGFQWWFFWFFGLVAAMILKASREGISQGKSLMAAIVGETFVLKVFSFIPSLTTYPFSLNWSEGSRWYYASLLFANKLYNHPYRPNFIDLPFDMLNSILFLFGRLPIWVFRLWSISLTLGMAALTAALLVRRLKISDRLPQALAAACCFLILFQQGGVYYHLLLSVVIVLLGVSAGKPWLSLVSIFIASLWVGMDRINWYPVPGMLAVALYLMEEPVRGYRRLVRYSIIPLAWLIIGAVGAVAGVLLAILITGSDPKIISAVSSPLLWYRLFPNPTYRFGVLPASLAISLPVWLVIGWGLSQRRIHVLRLLGLVGMLLVLYLGGLVASVKIGGGADLHNMDAYRTMLLIVGAYIFFGRFTPEAPAVSALPPWPLTALLILTLVASQSTQLVIPYDRPTVENALATLNSYVGQMAARGQVLFISERQLVTFGYVSGVAMVPDYENDTLTEMVMSNNQTYLGHFYQDLSDHRFSLIVVKELPTTLQGSSHVFGEENDIWVLRVSQPLLCKYEPIPNLSLLDLLLLIPRQAPANCP